LLYGHSPEALNELQNAAIQELHDRGAVDDLMRRVRGDVTASALHDL